MYLEVLDIELDSVDVKSILYHALLLKYCDVFESKFENFNLNKTPWHSLEEYGFQAELFYSFANANSGSGGLRKCYYCGKHGYIRSNCPSWRLKSPSEKTSVKWPGVWRRKEWAGEGKKEREERKRKIKSKSWKRLAAHRKGKPTK